ncbi:family 16 glycosylhydrolase [Seonamhaeicola algicola]|uniref:Family 16 glycosylhydrolase n=1 Tax=Seonamhaeicola algicola TaxID=1719036 RepID=A0A5C7AX32_9FLAO|nr:family 16 glycosylhydrolase [Seonamhaeicola algicola]TXE12737.1 family 16 glycosylhydrolase [Seonamhaeicola algicola]
MKTTKTLIVVIFILLACKFSLHAQLPAEIDSSWEMVWNDEFNVPNNQLEQKWGFQNGPSGHILSGRYRDNVTTNNGVLEIEYRHEQKNGQDYTSGNMWTNQEFQYGYFECRYKYAAAGATNNSFWIMNRSYESITPPGRGFELDINEGHFPNEVNTNIHKFDEGFANRTTDSKSYVYGVEPGVSLPLEIPITTKKIRFSSNNNAHFHIRELRVYNDNNRNFPDVYSETADSDVPGLVNHARASGTQITVSGTYSTAYNHDKANMVDGNVAVNSWVSQINGQKWVELEWSQNKTVGCVQFINGWDGPNWKGLISDYKVEYWNGSSWVTIAETDTAGATNFAEVYHTYGFKWDENEFVWYFDGEEIRRTPNTHAYGFAPIWLSGAVIAWSGPVVPSEIDGTKMRVDYVRVYKKKNNPPSGSDTLTSINSGATSVSQGQIITATVEYDALTTRDLRVNLKSNNGTLYGHQIKTVGAGSGTETFSITTTGVPVGSGYKLETYMSPQGGDWNNRVAGIISTPNNISVTQPAPATDDIVSITGPNSFSQNQNISATVNYSTTTARDLRVNFKSSNGTLYGHQIKTVTGSGSENFSFTTTGNPPVGNGYILQTYMSPVGGNWNNRIGDAVEKTNISVTSESLKTNSAKSKSAENDFALFPNPVKNELRVMLPKGDLKNNAYLYIYNSLGSEVMKKSITNSDITLGLSSIPSGMYIIKVLNGNALFTEIFIKE